MEAPIPQPVYGDVHVAAALTNISVAYMQSADAYIADQVFPTVPVQHQADKYFIYRKADFFRDQAQQRADATESAGGGFNLDTDSYSASVWAFHKDIGEQVRSNADPAVDIEVSTTNLVTQTLLIRRERFFVQTYMTTAIWGTDITGVTAATGADSTHAVYWDDDANADPFTDIANGQTTILQNTGQMANTFVISWPVYQALRKSPLIIDRIKYTNPTFAGTVTPQLLAQVFDIDRVVVSKAVYNSSVEGNATQTFNFIMGKHALLCHRAPAPGLMVPSAGYIFAWSGFTGLNNVGIRVKNFPIRRLSCDRVEGEMAFDMKKVASDLGYFFSGIVS